MAAWFHPLNGSPLGASLANASPREPPPAPTKRTRARPRVRSLPASELARLRGLLKSSVSEPTLSGFSSDEDDEVMDEAPLILTPTKPTRRAPRGGPSSPAALPFHLVTPDAKPTPGALPYVPFACDLGAAAVPVVYSPSLTRSLTPPPLGKRRYY